MKNNTKLAIVLSVLGCMGFMGCSDDSSSGGASSGSSTPSCNCPNGQCDAYGNCTSQPSPDACNNQCSATEKCVNGECKPNTPGPESNCNNQCNPDQKCVGNKCVNLSEICEPDCLGDTKCVNNECVFECEVHCGNDCCEADQVCDVITNKCASVCTDGTPQCGNECCSSNEECIPPYIGCSNKCSESQHRCTTDDNTVSYCCGNHQLCNLDNYDCVLDCPYEICGDKCCAENETCFEGACVAKCSEVQTRCGADNNLCCDNSSEICVFNKCLPRGKTCSLDDVNSCALDEFCDPASLTCVKASESPNVCEYRPNPGEFKPKAKWRYTENKVENTPAVADLNGDGTPEVFFVNMSYQLLALDGATGAIIAKSTDRQWNRYDGMAAADIDKDGKIEVIATTAESKENASGLAILNLVKNGDGWKWQEKAFLKIADNRLVKNTNYWVDIHPAIADIDSDGIAEIVTTRGIIKGNDLTKWQCELTFPSYHAWYQYGFVIADLDRDGQSEIIGHRMYNNKCELIMEDPVDTFDWSKVANSGVNYGWGFTAVADLIDDKGKPGELKPEIVRVKSLSAKNGAVSVWKVYKNGNTWTQEKQWETTHPGGGGGHPNIADFDGDTKAEIGIAGGSKYAVFKGNTGDVLWSVETNDSSSYRTGSSVFDFEGDGKAEVVYRDQCWVRIYRGTDGHELWSEKATSGTVLDYPLIVDIDADGKTEIITTSSNYGNATQPVGTNNGCGFDANTPFGLVAYEDSWGNWVRTRQIWNQHTYHVTNINDDGSVPKNETANWLTYNNYRQNVQPEGVFNAPNFVAGDLESSVVNCNLIKLIAHVSNEGSYGVRAGLPVQFFVKDVNGQAGVDAYIGTATVESPLAPSFSSTATLDWNLKATVNGEEVTVKLPAKIYFHVDKPSDDAPNGVYPECHDNDNVSAVKEVKGCEAA